MAYFAYRDKRSGPVRLFRGPILEPTGPAGSHIEGLSFAERIALFHFAIRRKSPFRKEMSQATEHGQVGPQGEQEHVSVHTEASSFTPQQEVPEPQVPQPNAVPLAVPFLQPQMAANMLQFLQQMAGAYVPPPPEAAPPPPPPPVVVVTIEKLKKNGAEEFRGDQIAEPMIAKRWLERVSRVLGTMRVPTEQRGDLAIDLLQDAAYDWWKRVRANVPEPVPWATFDELFREEYVPEHFMEEKCDEFMKFTQGELTLPEYRQKFDELAEFGRDMVPMMEKRCKRFREGLRPDLSSGLVSTPRNDINDLYKQALEMQAALFKKAEYEQAQKMHPRPPPSPKPSSSSKRPPPVPSSSHTSKKAKFAPALDCPMNPGEPFPTATPAAASAAAAQPASSQKSVAASSQPKRPAQSAQSGKAPARSTLSYLCTFMPPVSNISRENLENPVVVSNPLGHSLRLNHIYFNCPLGVQGKSFPANLIELPHREFDVILGMDWLATNQAVVDCGAHTVRLKAEDGSEVLVHDTVTLDENLTYEEEPVEILARETRQLRNKTIPLVKVLWRSHTVEEATWETEESMRTRYPHLFSDQ
ncbi:unnamed protein product [Cuscuta campestris]|uniref:Retrotransposon gag domain-containing protein n=1 Tax=Cuscuta campestris TaxID=132261 RepID=A0A484MWX5_9ASTE|nr:unnamed protein product [Cuscuta campestris]